MNGQNFFQTIVNINKIRILQVFSLFFTILFFSWVHVYNMLFLDKTFIDSLFSSTSFVVAYSISILSVIMFELYHRKTNGVPTNSYTETASYGCKEILKTKSVNNKKMPNAKIGSVLCLVSALLLILSFVLSSTILVFIGLSLTLWGLLFFFIKSPKTVSSSILNYSVQSFYSTVDRIMNDMKLLGQSVYISPLQKDANLPEYLSGLEEMTVFISSNNDFYIPSIGDLTKKRFLVEKPKGICISPPGSELTNIFEKELRNAFDKNDYESFYDSLSGVIVTTLGLASSFDIERKNDHVTVKITDSVFAPLYSPEQKLKSINSLGCPLVSAVACALAMITRKSVTISKIEFSRTLESIEVTYNLIEG